MDSLYSTTPNIENITRTSELSTDQGTDSFYSTKSTTENTTQNSKLWTNQGTDGRYSTTGTTENTSKLSEFNISWTNQETTSTSNPEENINQTTESSSSWTNRELDSFYTSTARPENTTLTFESWVKENNHVDSLRDLYDNMNNILVEAVQYHGTSYLNINNLCDIMTNYSGTRYQSYVELKELYDLSHDDEESTETDYFSANDNNDDDDSTYYQDSRSYDYQLCSEFGQFPVSSKISNLSNEHLFDSVESQIQQTCGQFFGPNFTTDDLNEKISYTNMIFGGLNFNVANTLFVHGSLDPWHALGFYTKKSDSLYQTVFINGSSHCADMQHASNEDIQELKEARKEILEILKIWLQ